MNSNEYQIKRAVISVSDKTGIIELATELENLGIEIFSTGGTAKSLREAGLQVKSISQLTGFPEILDGRVKTLHPAVHAGLLARLDDEKHIQQLDENDISSIDLLIVNLYPFEKTLEHGAEHDEVIENIDIGGPAMLRSAAKNYLWTAVVVNPERYNEVIKSLKEKNLTLDEKLRCELASEVFNHTSYYDSVIASYFRDITEKDFPMNFSLAMKNGQELRYGENPHQEAHLYGNFSNIFKYLHGKELSYNNILDIDGASRLILEFDEPAVAIIKHTNPCGVALGNNLIDAYNKAFSTDTVSAFGGIIAFNRIIDKDTAEAIHGLFTEVLIAPDFTEEALAILTKKRDRRLIKADYDLLRKSLKFEIRSVSGGYLVQSTDKKLLSDELKVVTKRQPTEDELKALLFGWKIAKHVKSNSIVYTTSDRTLGVGAGQMSRVDSSRIAMEKAKEMGLDLTGSAMASDAFFPFADGIQMAQKAGATCVIQPGGSVRDNEVIAAADELDMAMVFTGMRHFKH